MSDVPSSPEREWTLPAGFAVKIGGLPYTLGRETPVRGFREPEHPQPRPGTPILDRARRVGRDTLAPPSTDPGSPAK